MIRWGILGCGSIARKFAADLALVKNAKFVAIGSRSKENAQLFAKDFPVPHIHDSYEALVANPEVDVIYVASPHSHHHEHTLLCLEHGKAVLCEKAFAVNHRQAKEMISAAKEKHLFLMEAMWTKFLPHYEKMISFTNSGNLGEINSVLINFGFRPRTPVPARLFDPELAGGTILDIGVYNVFIAMSILGRPDEIDAHMKPAGTGVDEQCSVLFRYKNGAMAQLFSSFIAHLPTEADINGSNGRLRLTSRFYAPESTLEFYPDRMDSKQLVPFDKPLEGWGYYYEAKHVSDCLQKGLKESPVMTHENTLVMMQVLDEIRQKAGIRYEADL
ncbi:MAG: Gfo/Idh/MocA family oxidoreductase [Chitinophagaceae bacterium]|nr:Gfo/Idh/MocA family oxidoreductase [Chitinophagaceae bacterium]